MRHWRSSICTVIVLAASGCAEAQSNEGSVDADRPGSSAPARLVAPGVAQLEIGGALAIDHQEGETVRLVAAPTPLLRFGISRRLEVRFSSDGTLWRTVTNETERRRDSGFAAPAISAKIALWEEEGRRPAISVIPALRQPTGSAVFSTRGWDPSLVLAASKELPWGFGADFNALVSMYRDGDRHLWQPGLSAAVGRDAGHGWGWFGEMFGVRGPDGAAGLAVNGGVKKSLGPSFQVDASVGHRITQAAPAWILGFGFVMAKAP
jgi:hypothetical protein